MPEQDLVSKQARVETSLRLHQSGRYDWLRRGKVLLARYRGVAVINIAIWELQMVEEVVVLVFSAVSCK